uniref:COR413-like protein n=1 Tax=Gossypium barbadense TaxID=3634 RepID=Q4KUQ3_GOSBA|nr:cold-related protein Cor413 [Gossypium barbadense]ABI97481.1 COR413-like protein [Gossypium barbadense]
MVGKKSYLAMRSEREATDLIASDFQDLIFATKKLANHAIKLGSWGFGTTLLEWIASFAAIYLLILDRTNWKTNILTALLIPYIFLSLPSFLFNILRGEVGKWIAFYCSRFALVLPYTFPRLAGTSWSIDTSNSGGTEHIFKHNKERLDWCGDMPRHSLLSTSGAHQSIGWVSKFIHQSQWNIQHNWHNYSVGLPCLGFGH